MNRRHVVNGQVFIWTRRGWRMVLNGYIRTRKGWRLMRRRPGRAHQVGEAPASEQAETVAPAAKIQWHGKYDVLRMEPEGGAQ
jgi:hypothetical protein